jgi:iron only hydrogenase large subunit-like protein
MEYNTNQLNVLKLLKEEKEVCLMVAPSFVIDFNYSNFVPMMRSLGFSYVTEITFGAKIVNKNYEKYILQNPDKKTFISSTCPTIVDLIKSKYPQLTKYLIPFDSPVITMAKILKKNFPNSKIVFLSPCYSKKFEAKLSGLIQETITFKEMKQILKNENIKPKKESHLFNRFYNDYTKVYPVSGGLSSTMKKDKILDDSQIIICEGQKKLDKIINEIDHNQKKFYDILFCEGGCIGGPEVNARTPLWFRKLSIISYLKKSKKEKIGHKLGLGKYTKKINFEKEF